MATATRPTSSKMRQRLRNRERTVHPPLIRNISVEKLFNRYSYTIPDQTIGTLPGEYNRLILLYGDNGSGKTTVLRLVFHLLSPLNKKGHRTFLGETPFRRFSLTLGDETTIDVSRDHGSLVGAYEITLSRTGRNRQTFFIDFSNGKLDPNSSDHEAFIEYLNELEAFPYFLTDNRDFTGDTIDDSDDESRTRALDRAHRDYILKASGDYVLSLAGDLPRSLREGHELEAALRRAEEWLKHQAYSSANTGLVNASNVYLSVLEHLATAIDPQETGQGDPPGAVQERLRALAKRADEYAEFDLGTPFPARRFLQLLEHSAPDRRHQLENALAPHVDSSMAQLDALQNLYDLLVAFTSGVNSFLADKTLRFSNTRRHGISILSSDNTPLEPSQLSSGERQLLLLLCNTLVAREDSRLFIIDEPEISLNVTWQRKLLDVLLDLTSGTSLQFLVATHSIEMVAGHRESLARLKNTHAA